MKIKEILLFFGLFLLVGCRSFEDVRLEQALEFAGSNRKELDKVLEYYSNEPEKEAAAHFLIRNMPHYYSYKGWQLDTIYQILATESKVSKATEQKWKGFQYTSLEKVYDAHVITADYLIENIDLAFEVWKKPWNRTLGFDDFCELILPYRIGDEPLSAWRKVFHDFYAPKLDSAYQGSDVVAAGHAANKMIIKKKFFYNISFSIPHLEGTFLFNHLIGYCRELCDYTIYAMRSCGLPVAVDFMVQSPEYQGSHSWNALRDTTGKFLPFYFDDFIVARGEGRTDGRKKGKVYRHCFGEQKELFPGIAKDTKIPFLFRNPYVKEVGEDYFGDNEARIPLQRQNGNYVYLGIFSADGWIPIDITLAEEREVIFQSLESNLIYMPLYQEGMALLPAGYPFIYTNGKVELLNPDSNYKDVAVLKRKMPLMPKVFKRMYEPVLGSKIEGGNHLSFVDADLLYQFGDTLRSNYNELTPLHIDKKYRYIRYTAPRGKHIEFAELAIYRDSLCKQPVALHRITDREPLENLDNITDGDVLSYYYGKDTLNNDLIYDMKEKTFVGKIFFSPRNDDNYVWPGDEYELFYQNGIDGWKSLGVCKAMTCELKYRTPHNALLWLRNRTKGKEEQVFVIKNGQQAFAIDLK